MAASWPEPVSKIAVVASYVMAAAMCGLLLIGSYHIAMVSVVPTYEFITSTGSAETTLWSAIADMGRLVFEVLAALMLPALGAWILYSVVVGRAA